MIFHLAASRLRRLSTAPLFVALLLAPAWAAPGSVSQPAIQSDELLRQAIANEKAATRDEYYAWMDRLQKPRGTVTKLMVETPSGILARTVAINDRPLSAVERQQDDDRINRLLDPAQMREKAEKQREDQRHVERLLFALPDAFRCRYSSESIEESVLHLECEPNPHFSPPNYESQVLQGMQAVISIDRNERRITRIEGTLFKDVTFGWGFLGRLNRGGRIEITQSKVTPKHWGITKMQLVFDGRVVVVKPVHIEETESSWDYRPVPAMSVAQALEFLRSVPAKH